MSGIEKKFVIDTYDYTDVPLTKREYDCVVGGEDYT